MFDNCLIKITTNSNKVSKISKKFKIVNETNKIRIIYPNGGELIESESWFNIKWKSDGLKSELFKILFSINSGRTWERLESRLLNVNEYLWKIPNIESEDCKIKIMAVENQNIYDISEQVFSISKISKLKLSNPLNKQEYYSGENMQIKWNVINVRGKKVNVYYSIDENTDWKNIGRAIPNNGYFNWKMPFLSETSEFAKVKVEMSNNRTPSSCAHTAKISSFKSKFSKFRLDVPETTSIV